MTPEWFVEKWGNSSLKERSGSQSHFNDLCALLSVETPTEADQKGEWYCFERGASKTVGGDGWADVWKRGHFGWEYKGKHKNLERAHAQLQQYAIALENPPLLIVSDMEQIIIRTNWTNTVSEKHEIGLEDLLDPYKRELLRWAFLEPERLKPAKTIDALTREAADRFAQLAITLRERGHEPQTVAHFINRLVFCMFAEDINLLPRQMFSQIIERAFNRPDIAQGMLAQLFTAMKDGGLFGVDEIEWFNGGLFDDATALPLTRDELKIVWSAAELDWSDIDPSIFGTLFERGLDPSKRSQLGAHYTDPEKIMMIVRPVVIEPLLAEWEEVKAKIGRPRTSATRKKELLGGFLDRLRSFRVLDPACGSGNFLYLALLALKDIEHRVNLEAEVMGLGRQFPGVGPEAVRGIEINPYAAELARVTVWIGEIQWMRKNGFDLNRRPVLKPLQNIECRDAVLNEDGTEAEWPSSDAIIGNPPFLGNKKMIGVLGGEYTAKLRNAYDGRVPKGSDLVVYWFFKSHVALAAGKANLTGLVATQAIRRGASNKILKKIADEEGIFEAWADEPWVVDGAQVRVSLICFGKINGRTLKLNGAAVDSVSSDLFEISHKRGEFDPVRLNSNLGVAFQGPISGGPFEIPGSLARTWLMSPTNPNGRRNSDVLRPWMNADDLTGRSADYWIIDFGVDVAEEDASLFEQPYSHLRLEWSKEDERRRAAGERLLREGEPKTRAKWWLHQRPRPPLRAMLAGLHRYIATPRVAKFRTFVWVNASISPDTRLVVVARDDDVTFGILHSRFHELWSLRCGARHGVGNDPEYVHTRTFETFPFPDGFTPDIAAADYGTTAQAERIAVAAQRLDVLRNNWLNPPDLVKRIPEVVPGYPDRFIPAGGEAAVELKSRTLTNLYNMRPAWLDNAHKALDDAVAEAYGWPADLDDHEILSRLLALNLKRGGNG